MGRKERKRFENNQEVKTLLEKESLTDEEILKIKRLYTGIGGLTNWDNGQFFTPESVTKFIVKMMGIEKGRILEPSCGSGAFFEHLPNECDLVGIEIMSEAAQVASICYPDAQIIQGNAFEVSFDEPFDYVVGNPPFGLSTCFSFECGGKFKSEAAFIEYGIRNLKKGGIIGMIVPDSLLANAREKKFRQWILENHRVLAVVSLPTPTFYHVGTSVKTSFLMIQKGRGTNDEDYEVFMSLVEKIGWDSRGRKTECELDFVFEAYASQPFAHFNQPTTTVERDCNFSLHLPIQEAKDGQYAFLL